MAKTKVPKRVGGVKIPKKVRKEAKKAIRLVEPAVRDLAIAGLTMAAQRLSPRKGNGAARAGVSDGPDLGAVLRETAIEGARRFLAGFEEVRRESEDGPKKARRPAKRASARARRPAAPAARG